MGAYENERWESDGLGSREPGQSPWRGMRVVAACSTEAGIQAHDPAILVVNVHRASLKRTWRGLGDC